VHEIVATHIQAHSVEDVAQVIRRAGGLVGPALLGIALASCTESAHDTPSVRAVPCITAWG
jgi:hypothetical protein